MIEPTLLNLKNTLLRRNSIAIVIYMPYILTTLQLANVLTKESNNHIFQMIISKLGIDNIY